MVASSEPPLGSPALSASNEIRQVRAMLSQAQRLSAQSRQRSKSKHTDQCSQSEDNDWLDGISNRVAEVRAKGKENCEMDNDIDWLLNTVRT